jgi:hypothetical protein
MNGLYLKFTSTGDITLEPQIVQGNKSLLRQNAAVILLTVENTDKIFPTKGTTLLLDATKGKISDINSASHSGNFAALKIQDYLREYEYEANTLSGDVYQDIQVRATTASNGVLRFNMTFDEDLTTEGTTTF